jgi:UbiA prenyltransferase family protein
MKLSTALRLGRVSNLPTVTSNVVAAVALAGGHPSPGTLVAACVALSLMYVAGMWLNDAFDRDLDRALRPERPIPRGEVAAATVFDVGFLMLGAGIVLVSVTAMATGAGWKPVMSVVALASLIVFYDANHKQNPLSPVVMGLCRAAVYTTAALLVRADLCAPVVVGCAMLLAYLVGLTYAARQENLVALTNVWPLAFLAVPFVVERPHEPSAYMIYAGFLVWTARCVMRILVRDIRTGITGLIAGISLLDALLVANLGRDDLTPVAIGAFLATLVLQRFVPGT